MIGSAIFATSLYGGCSALRLMTFFKSGLFAFQENELSTVSKSLARRIWEVLNFQFINQKSFSVSILSILIFAIVIVVTIIVSRYLRLFLKKRVLIRMELDTGIEYSVLRVIHYVVIVLGLLYAIKAGFGADLTSVAVVLGFLSVGIGFGLQYIASDLISGFILLFERPMRVGDEIRVGDMEGRVAAIRIRTTIIITLDNMAVILPNSELVRNKFINFSYGSTEVRMAVPVGVAYDSDIKKVTDALLEAASSVQDVLRTRPTEVRLHDFGDSSINFQLMVWVDGPEKRRALNSKLNFAIHRVFMEKGIEIPFPQRELRIRSGSLVSPPLD